MTNDDLWKMAFGAGLVCGIFLGTIAGMIIGGLITKASA